MITGFSRAISSSSKREDYHRIGKHIEALIEITAGDFGATTNGLYRSSYRLMSPPEASDQGGDLPGGEVVGVPLKIVCSMGGKGRPRPRFPDVDASHPETGH